jgi:Flp pilus assembly protein TadG
VRRLRDERGAAPVDFVLVGGLLLTPLFLGVVQLGFDLHVRNTLVACASEGARYAANADRTLADGEARTRDCITSSLRASYAENVQAGVVSESGVPTVEVTVRAPLPIVAFAGPSRGLVVHGHALREQP